MNLLSVSLDMKIGPDGSLAIRKWEAEVRSSLVWVILSPNSSSINDFPLRWNKIKLKKIKRSLKWGHIGLCQHNGNITHHKKLSKLCVLLAKHIFIACHMTIEKRILIRIIFCLGLKLLSVWCQNVCIVIIGVFRNILHIVWRWIIY